MFYREQKQKETTKTVIVNNFPKDRDYRREAMQTTVASAFTGSSKSFNTVVISTILDQAPMTMILLLPPQNWSREKSL